MFHFHHMKSFNILPPLGLVVIFEVNLCDLFVNLLGCIVQSETIGPCDLYCCPLYLTTLFVCLSLFLSLSPSPSLSQGFLVMSNSCRMPLKAYLQCIRKTECFKQDPADDRMELCSRDKHVQEECSTFETNYKQCKRHLVGWSFDYVSSDIFPYVGYHMSTHTSTFPMPSLNSKPPLLQYYYDVYRLMDQAEFAETKHFVKVILLPKTDGFDTSGCFKDKYTPHWIWLGSDLITLFSFAPQFNKTK